MVFLYDGTAVGGREIAMSMDNIKTISGAHAAGVAILQGPVDITKPTTIETLNTGGEEDINPFSEKVDNSLFNGFPNSTPQPNPILPQATISVQPEQNFSNVTSPQVDSIVIQQTIQPNPTLSAAPQTVESQVVTTDAQPQSNVSAQQNIYDTNQQTIQPSSTPSTSQPEDKTSLGIVEPQQISTQESPAPQFQPVANYSASSEANIFDNPVATPVQPDPTLSPAPQAVATDTQFQPSAPAPQIVSDEIKLPNNQEFTDLVQPQTVVSEEQKSKSLNNQASGETVSENNIGINSIVLSSPLFPKDIIAGIRITKEETLYDVSVRVGIPVDLLSSVNNITEMNLKPGQFLLLPPGLQRVYKYEIEIFSDISKRIPDLLNNQKTPEQDLNGIGEGFRM